MQMTVYIIAAALLPLLLPAAATAAAPRTIGQPNCKTNCGGVDVPYPFGLGPAGCYLRGFNLTCDEDGRPPRLLLGDSTLRVVEISTRHSTVLVMRAGTVSIDAASGSGTFGGGLRADGPYTLSTGNELVLTGCNVQATLQERNSSISISRCSSLCPDGMDVKAEMEDDADVGSDGRKYCDGGVGCCQGRTGFARWVRERTFRTLSYDVQLEWFGEDRAADEKRLATRVFVAKEGWFDDRKVHHNRAKLDAVEVPVLLDWEIGAENLLVGAVANTTGGFGECSPEAARHICKSNYTLCTKLRGYTCYCQEGFSGNPYIADGCQDVDECRPMSSQEKVCFAECTNSYGSYECRCPQGTHGNPKVLHGCVKYVHIGSIVGIGVGVGAGIILLILLAIFISQQFKLHRAKKLRQKFFKQNRGQLLQQLVSQRADISERMIITLEELEKATNNFDKARELGGGGHGTVYKGILSDLHVVAIKKPKKVVQKEIDEFINEVAILSQVNHRNVVKLYGCCLETEVPMLVYEFISNGTLHEHLHVDGEISLSWEDRLRIASETAKSIAYLHSTASTPIIHRDIKSVNILLDDTLTAKVVDFGASRYVPIDKSGVTTMVQGTIGYMDPMYFYTGRLTEKSDVYGFGVVLVELLTRKKPFLYMSSEGDGLVAHFASLLAEGNLKHILDQQVIEEGGKEVEQVASLAMACVKLSGEDRPTMRQVEWTLEGIQSSSDHLLHNRALVKKSKNNDIAIRCPLTNVGSSCEELTRQFSMEEDYTLSGRYPR
uniref:Uncharacterized protein n=1 Tax=Avena sativa TaxID=4498 RepID=A0ACD5Y2U3_AVESA